ncbi:LicD family protein [Sulfobacillus harzensis]|uniref:LicD family protein n=1 Tax=Sulfobacillus harzensis TaxID=2729629 RepID=A0A7Y0Q3V6_9FIRM|nr:LicD family protein [Sulfobacillus harzensis]NMP23942.1 LicD family protein [Sulfobacillus harzensis]
MDSDQLRAVQIKELEILLAVDRVCRKHHITYYLIGGSALGAVRHNGFIPWDDDIDLGMPRNDYERFLNLGTRELGEKYYVQTYRSQPNFPFTWAKVNLNNTTFIETALQNLKIHHGVFIDVFPLDGVPRGLACRFIQNFLFKALMRVPISISPRLTFWRCAAMDWIISRVPDDRSKVWANRAWGTERECMDRAVYGIPAFMNFEGHKLPVPQQCTKYLSNFYGNYLELPPPEERHGHYPLVVDLTKSHEDYFR